MLPGGGTVPRRSFSRTQTYLLPPAIDDWVPADHPIRFVAIFVDGLRRDEWLALGIAPEGEERGAPAYDARLVMSVWLAGVMQGIRSARALEAACRDQISFRWLTGNQVPDHNTLWRFYRAHRTSIHRLVRKTVTTAAQAGLVDLALLAVDGSKVAGNARRARTMTAAELAGLQARSEQVIAELDEANAEQDEHGAPRLPAELQTMQALRERIAAAQQQVMAEDGPDQVNLTDPDTRVHKTRQGYVTGYNAQAGVVRADLGPDQTGGLLIVAADVISEQDDHGQLLPMLAQSRANLGAAPALLAADGGYHSAATVAACARQEQVVVMPDTQGRASADNPYHAHQFHYDADTDTFTCQHTQRLRFRGEKHRRGRAPVRVYQATAATCRGCPAFGSCTTNWQQGRVLEVQQEHVALRQHRAWMETEPARVLSARRKSLVEPAFGILKERLGLRRFQLRGLANVRAEWNLLALGFNLRTLARAWTAGLLTEPPGTPPPTSLHRASSICRILAHLIHVVTARRCITA